MKLKLFFIVVTIFCSYIFSSCTKIESVESVPGKADKTSENKNILNGSGNLTISQDPIEILLRTKLTNTDLSLIQSKVGQVDISSFRSRAYSESVTIYSAKINPTQKSKSLVSKLMITDELLIINIF